MDATKERQKFDVVGFIMEVEQDGFNHENQDHIDVMQHMVDTGIVWSLQGSRSKLVKQLILNEII